MFDSLTLKVRDIKLFHNTVGATSLFNSLVMNACIQQMNMFHKTLNSFSDGFNETGGQGTMQNNEHPNW